MKSFPTDLGIFSVDFPLAADAIARLCCSLTGGIFRFRSIDVVAHIIPGTTQVWIKWEPSYRFLGVRQYFVRWSQFP